MTPSSAQPQTTNKRTYDVLCILHGKRAQTESFDNGSLKIGLASLADNIQRKLTECEAVTDEVQFEKWWATTVWGLLCVVSKLVDRRGDTEESQLEERLNVLLLQLANCWRAPLPFQLQQDPEIDYEWQQFCANLTTTLHTIHGHTMGQPTYQEDLAHFCENQLQHCISTFKRLCTAHWKTISYELRKAQVERVSTYCPIPTETVDAKNDLYTKVVYCMGIICARIQGLRYWSGYQPHVEAIKPMFDSVVNVVEQLLADCLFCSEPLSSAILVTNNLFSFESGCLAAPYTFQQFDVQIISEETANLLQCDLSTTVESGRNPSVVFTGRPFPSAALLAMKPTTGTKRNNATASAEGGNTAHKKSDVNSKESVVLAPTFNDKYGTWQATYPHLLCTTRQKDSALLDARSNQIGKRPLFYFYIKGTVFSPKGGVSHCYTLSLPFTIATRRNQDCQVQRMMSSYTATCFWLYGTSTLDGLIMNWTEAGITWNRFKQLYKAHFKLNAEVTRDLSDDDFLLLENKLTCEDCASVDDEGSQQRLITFKNVMCPHLRYDNSESTTCKFSVWRGILEILQLFQDMKTNAKTLWNDNFLLGFIDHERVAKLLRPYTRSVMCMTLSYVVGGSVCIVVKPSNGPLIQLEPLDLKRLQSKGLNEYLADIATAEGIDFLLDGSHNLIPVTEIIDKYNIGADSGTMREITSNITHCGTTDNLHTMRFTPMRVAVVTCRSPPKSDSLSGMAGCLSTPMSIISSSSSLSIDTARSSHMTSSMGGNMSYSMHTQPTPLTPITPLSMRSTEMHTQPVPHRDFMSELQHLMKIHNRSSVEVMNMLSYMNYDPYVLPPMSSMGMGTGMDSLATTDQYHARMGMH